MFYPSYHYNTKLLLFNTICKNVYAEIRDSVESYNTKFPNNPVGGKLDD